MQDLNDKVTGGTLTATEWNEVPSEIQNVIEGLGITLSSGDLNQLGKAIAGYVANGAFYTDSGAADAYVLTEIGSKQALTAYTDGATFEFNASNAGTGGAATVNVAGLGVKNIKLRDGTDPAAGQIDGRTLLKFDLANDRCELIESGMVNIVEFTTSDTYNPPAGVKGLEFIVVGAGGGAGGADGQGAGTGAVGGSGGGGGASILATNNIEASYTITIGAGGTAGAAAGGNGGAGGNSSAVSVAVNMIGNGGAGGAGMVGTASSTVVAGGAGGTSSGGDSSVQGGGGLPGRVSDGNYTAPPISGSSFLGGGVTNSVGVGITGIGFGSGGSGGITEDAATNNAGGAGKAGVIIIREFF